MRFSKYYDALRTNRPFFNSRLNRKIKILRNFLTFIRSDKKIILKHKPFIAQIEPNSTCNLRCGMCIRDKIGVPIGNISFDDFKKILDKLDCLFKIHLSGQGEPFLNKDLFKIIRYANEIGIIVNTNTNATLLTDKIIQEICKVNMGEIAISIESTKKKTYEKIRKGANFDEVIKNIQELSKKIKEKKKKTIISLAVTILKDNIDEIPDFIKLAKNTGVSKIIFQTLQEKEDYISKYEKGAKGQKTSNLKKIIKEKFKEAKRLAMAYNINLIFDEEKSRGCLWPWRSIYVTWNGNVTACCKILDYRTPVMGNIIKEDFWKIWNGKNYQLFRKLLRVRKAPSPCIGCNRV